MTLDEWEKNEKRDVKNKERKEQTMSLVEA